MGMVWARVVLAQAEGDLPQDDTPAKGCDPNCLCCRGGMARVWRTEGGWEPQPCGFCGGYPPRSTMHEALLGDRLDDLKQCCKAYSAQLKLKDPLRTFTLQRAQGILADMLELEAGRGTRGASVQPAPLDGNALNEPEEPQGGQ